MTNKEAKDKLYLQWQKFLEDNIDYAGISEAYKMAFKALEQVPKLQNRCHALTHGQICVFCPQECEHRIPSVDEKETEDV